MEKGWKIKSARKIAEKEIRQALHEEGKCFIAFQVELDAPIQEIVNSYLEIQMTIKR